MRIGSAHGEAGPGPCGNPGNVRFRIPTAVERTSARLKDEFQGSRVFRVACHLQLIRLVAPAPTGGFDLWPPSRRGLPRRPQNSLSVLNASGETQQVHGFQLTCAEVARDQLPITDPWGQEYYKNLSLK